MSVFELGNDPITPPLAPLLNLSVWICLLFSEDLSLEYLHGTVCLKQSLSL